MKKQTITSLLFIFLTGLVFLNNKQPFNIDLIINAFQFPISILPFLQFISNITETIPIAIATLLIFFYLRKNNKIKQSLFALIILIGAILVKTLKLTISRARPENIDYQSFPSGHVTMTTVFCLVLYLTIIKDIKNKTKKTISTILIVLLPILVGISRLALNHHWLTDVIAGLLLGISVSLIGYSYISNPHKLFK
ncbi:phosphatase PAP2 family protein [Candidatus Woesearchaeota archaeon]|jgi:undecaprenyl-diphosphatase|nr:phosphatase PAP2 family protein [Candidatus Woesearchaeota archaeon]MBT3438356.1 phosphatase PAP2 family protein [Candidatus Woesearchaeota archaeon]MBT4058013.1 phosphatase PAP2 family protein [Candidatus Woesearchaeota archaeon]MBT4207635.1 phosphatase PAP2 family protein [Candidatus Woesearchaeota archaeon]MBT4730602.1 phosphatase PAP2 family protein [Candidatus Woesearchaeota archaeon]